MEPNGVILGISSISNVSSQQSDTILLTVQCESQVFYIYIISLEKPSKAQRYAYLLLFSLCSQENCVMKRQLPSIVNAKFNPNYADLYAYFGVPQDDPTYEAAEGAAPVVTGVGGVYWLAGTKEFVIAYCSEKMENLVLCGKVIRGIDQLRELASYDGKCDAWIADATTSNDSM